MAQSANNVYLGNGSGTSGTLDLAGNALTIGNDLVIGQSSGTGFLNEAGGSFTATNVYVENGNSLSFGASDAVSNLLNLSGGSSATTTTSGNVTTNVNVFSGSTLNLGANLTLTGTMDVEDTGSVVHMNGNNISATTILLGWYDNQAVTLDRGTTPGSLSATNLYVYGQTLNLLPSDNINTFYMSNGATTLNNNVAVSTLVLEAGSTGTTMTSGNVTGSVSVLTGSTL